MPRAKRETPRERTVQIEEHVRRVVSRLRSLKADAKEVAAAISGELSAAENLGLHRRALKQAVRYAGMEPVDVQAEFGALYEYMVALGILAPGCPVFRQKDIFVDVSVESDADMEPVD